VFIGKLVASLMTENLVFLVNVLIWVCCSKLCWKNKVCMFCKNVI